MRASLSFVQQKFDEFNRLCFEGSLPPVPIVISNARTYLGVCAFKTRRDFFGRRRHYDFRLRISTRFDMPEDEIADTILHEMIHYYIAYNHFKDTSTHGRRFRQMMDDFNARFGRHISISHRLTETQRKEEAAEGGKACLVALIRFKDGRKGIKVVAAKRVHAARQRSSLRPSQPLSLRDFPSATIERIVTYYRQLMCVAEVASAELYVSDHPLFNRYPSSTALKVYFVDESSLAAALTTASCYVCDGRRLIEKSSQI